MKRLPHLLWACIAVAALASACKSEGTSSAPAANTKPHALISSSSSAQATIDAMDTRTPVPLVPMMANHQKQNMREHLLVVQEITKALSAKDFPAIEQAVGRIGYSEQMGQMCTHMGAGAPGFTEAALDFHHTADTIADAAKKRDPDAVLAALTRTLTTCTSCHATFKQHVVDDSTWSSLTQTAPSSPMHH